MTGRAGSIASLVLAVVLAAASVAADAASARGLPQSVPLEVTFADLVPGDVRGTSWPLRIPEDARIESASLRQEGPGDLRWAFELCPSSGASCVDGLTPGTSLAAGDYDVRVTVAVVDLEPGLSQTLEGRYLLVPAGSPPLAFTGGGPPGDRLALTGATSAVPLVLAALAAASLGLLLVAVARHRRGEQDAPPVRPPFAAADTWES